MIDRRRSDHQRLGLVTGRRRGSAITHLALVVFGLVVTSTTSGCSRESALYRLAEAQRLSADLAVEFTKGSDAANRAVMADTDDASADFARQAEQAAQRVRRSADALRPLLVDLGYAEETGLLEEFGRRFDEYRACMKVDVEIVQLSRCDSNVRSLALTRIQQGTLTNACEATLRSLRDALARRTIGGTR